MTREQLLKNLERPKTPVDAVLDTDAYNEIDDQFAIAYMLKSDDKINTRAIFAAPFLNRKSSSPKDGMEKSYDEILNLLNLMGRDDFKEEVYKGSDEFLKNENTPVISPAANRLCELAKEYSPEKPLYVVAIGAITNVASALLIDPSIKENIVVVWLGGHAHHWNDNREFNAFQDVAAARIVFGCGVPLVQFPCYGVVSAFTVSETELNFWLKGKNPLCDYVVEHTKKDMKHLDGKPWSRIIWDVTAVSWLTGNFSECRIVPTPIPQYDNHLSQTFNGQPMQYIYYIRRDELVRDLFRVLSR